MKTNRTVRDSPEQSLIDYDDNFLYFERNFQNTLAEASTMTIKIPVAVTAIPPQGPAVKISIPEDLWTQIPETKRDSPEELSQYLKDSLRIGILSTVNASITIDTKEFDRVVREGISEMSNTGDAARRELETLVESKLTGDKSELAVRLQQAIGKNGLIETLFETLSQNLTDPDFSGSVPSATRTELESAVSTVKGDLDKALDITDEKTPLGKFVRNQNQTVADIQSLISTEFNDIKSALNVDEILGQKDAEIAELKDKSTHKGIHFENDAVEALQDIADVLGDRIEHTGGAGEGASRAKVGDIVIVIQHQGVPELRIAIEAKAGRISRKKLIEQVRNGVTNRNAVRGIGLMDMKYMGATQHILGQEGENYIVGVDWAEDDFFSLEITYRMLRSVMIAESLRLDGDKSIDVDAISKRLEQAKTDLGMIQSMKVQTTSAIGTLEGVRTNMDVMEKKVKTQLSEAEDMLRGEEE